MYALLQASQGATGARTAIYRLVEAPEAPRKGRLRKGPLKAGRHDADDRVALAVEIHGLAKHVRRPAQVALPEGVAQNDDPLIPRLFLLRQESPAQQRRSTQQRKEIG